MVANRRRRAEIEIFLAMPLPEVLAEFALVIKITPSRTVVVLNARKSMMVTNTFQVIRSNVVVVEEMLVSMRVEVVVSIRRNRKV